MSDMMNEYQFASIKSLRNALRSFKTLEAMGDATSITICLDLRRAMGDDPSIQVPILTDHQRRAIQLSLIDDLPTKDVARQLGTIPRVVEYAVSRGLTSMLKYLRGEFESDSFTPPMFELMRNSELSSDEIARRINKSQRSVEVAMSRYRKRERIPYRTRRRRNTRRASE